MSSRKCARDRLLELREDLRVRLVEHVRHHVQAAAVRHADQDVPDPGLGRLADHLVQHRDEHVEPLDREAGLAGEGALQEALERLDLRQPIEQGSRVDRIGRRAETPGFGRLPQPLALRRHEHVRVVVAGRRTVDPTQRLDGVVRRRAGIDQRAGYEARRQRTQILIGDAVCFREQRRVAGRRPPRGSSLAARCP